VVEQRTSVSLRTERDIPGINGKSATDFYDGILCNFCMKFAAPWPSISAVRILHCVGWGACCSSWKLVVTAETIGSCGV